MPKAGDSFQMPGAGEYVVVRSHEETGGEFVEMVWTLPPDAFAPPAHIHPTQVEEYEVLEGELEVMVDGNWTTLRAGDSASVPAGAKHTFKTPKGARVHNFHRPGSHFDTFIKKHADYATSSRFKGLKHPTTAIAMAKIWREHTDLLVPSNPLMRGAMAALGWVGRRRGY